MTESGAEAVELAAETAVMVVGAVGSLFEEDEEDRVVTNSDWGGGPAEPGKVRFD